MRRLVLVALMGLAITAVAGGFKFSKSYDVTFHVNQNGDTTEMIAMTIESEMDSFPYMDTFAVVAKTDSVIVTWLSPAMVAYITPGGVDTTATLACSVSYASTDIPGFEYVIPEDTVMANMIDDLVDSLEAIAGINDSITVEDSVTYIKLIAKFSTETHEGRWSLVYDGDLDTSYTRTTVAMWCDSFMTAINASDAGDYVTASDSTDSIYVISDQPGLLFDIYLGDSTVATDTAQANGTAYSTRQDTFNIGHFMKNDFGADAVIAQIILNASTDTAHGIGEVDSGYVWLYTDLAGVYYLLDSVVANSLPCTLYYAVSLDTLLKDGMWATWRVADTASDATYEATYSIDVDYLLKD